ncbi:MAG: Uma2 family endonuclease [Planctomycetia bacterium]|nr:Uma2 family endonuclease [Planctomycetia bacterium]
MATVLVADQCEIPGDVASLDAFRRWSRSPAFPTAGRIDWVASHIEVDMSPEDIFTHGTVKTAIVGRLWPLAVARGMHLFTGETRVSADAADLSVEPDVVVVSEESLESGRVRLVPAAGGRPDRFVEFEGGPDLVVEIVSDSSARKDTERLPIAYHAAGVREFWLVDARGADVRCTIHRREPGGWATDAVPGGIHRSAVFACGFVLARTRNPQGRFVYDLAVTPD